MFSNLVILKTVLNLNFGCLVVLAFWWFWLFGMVFGFFSCFCFWRGFFCCFLFLMGEKPRSFGLAIIKMNNCIINTNLSLGN